MSTVHSGKKTVVLALLVCILSGFGCVRVHLAQRIEQVKTNYNRGNFPRVLGFTSEPQSGSSNNPYDPPGNFTVHEVRSLIVKGTADPSYDYRDLFEPSLSAKLSAQKENYLRQLALIELRALVHQYFATHAPPYQQASQNPMIRRARYLLRKLSRLEFDRAWEKAEILGCEADLALLDGQYEAAQAAYALILDKPEDLTDEILGRYAKRYISSFERAISTPTLSMDSEQKTEMNQEFEANLRKIVDLIPTQPAGIYAQARLLAESHKAQAAFNTALLSWRRSDDAELRTLLDQFVQLQLEEYWPLMKTNGSFRKAILDQWNANKQSTPGSE